MKDIENVKLKPEAKYCRSVINDLSAYRSARTLPRRVRAPGYYNLKESWHTIELLLRPAELNHG